MPEVALFLSVFLGTFVALQQFKVWRRFRRRKKVPTDEYVHRPQKLTHESDVPLLPGSRGNVFEPPAIYGQRSFWERGGGVAMQGYAPIVKQTRKRHGQKCRCGDRVFSGERHICIYNAEYHLATLTDGERWKLVMQMRRLALEPPKPGTTCEDCGGWWTFDEKHICPATGVTHAFSMRL